MTSGESNTLGNGEGLFNAVFTVPSKDKNMYLAHFIVVTTLAHHQ